MISLLMHILAFLFIVGMILGSMILGGIIWLIVWACKGEEDY